MGYKEILLSYNLPLVSAVITTHNRVELLRRAVESVYSQTYGNIELIVVDDGSTDETEEWCKIQQFKYIRIPVGESRGGNYARNLGLKASNGKYVAFLDDDDFWLPEKIEKQVNLIEKTGNELVHCFRYIEIVNKNGEIHTETCNLSSNHSGMLQNRILYQITCLTSAILVNRKALLDIGGFDEKLMFWQEYELTIRLAQRKPFDMVPKPLLVYRTNASDKARLTNKYYGWKKAVEYIYIKHSDLYGRLGWISKFRVKLLFLRDSASRAKAANLDSIHKKHYRLAYLLNLPFRIYDKIRSYI